MKDPFNYSSELRWFFEAAGDTRQRMGDWFTAQGSLETSREEDETPARKRAVLLEETPRDDAYLAWAGCATCGVKRRSGKLEVKARLSEPQVYVLGGYSVVGLADDWAKWTVSPEKPDAFEPDLRASATWRHVRKSRTVQLFAWKDGRAEPVPVSREPEAGAQCELTFLEVENARSDWVTLGFETWGPQIDLRHILEDTVEAFFISRGASPVPLTQRASRGYPAWLAELGKLPA